MPGAAILVSPARYLPYSAVKRLNRYGEIIHTDWEWC
jgi:hypothetical protein